jgi:FecR protein
MSSRVRGFLLLGAILAAFVSANATELKEARVTQIIRDVKLLPNAAPARPAVVNDQVRDGTAVRTGLESRTELKFTDETLARLGANTIFSFTEGTRNLELTDGAMLLRVPKNAGGAKINTAAVTAAITGTTVMLEFHKNSYVKFIVLEGTGRIFLPSHLGESVLVHAGQMLIAKPDAKNLPNPVDVDIRQIRKTSRLIRGFGKMGSENLIAQTEVTQDEERAEGELYETNLAIYGGGTSLILNDQEHIRETNIAEEPPPPPPPPPPPVVPPVVPSAFGPPETITSPNPYPLGANNELTTAGPPKVVANATTNYGKIYRNTPLDGIHSLWFFGTTTPFDTASGFDTPDRSVFDLNNVAVFKFQSLQLVSNPTISIPNGISKLGLVGVDGISSASSVGILTFGGLNSVLLTTQKGSIILGGGISFQNIPNLFFYARGDGVTLNLSSPISGTSNLLLNSEGTVQINGNVMVDSFNAFSNGDFQQGSGIVTARDVTINSIAGNVAFDLSKFANLAKGGGTITLNANGSLTIIPSGGPTTRTSIAANAGTIDFNNSSLFHFNFSNSDSVSLSAGAGGIQAPNVEFIGPNLTLHSDGNINLFETELPSVKGQPVFSGLIDAHASIFATGDIQTAVLTAGGNISAGGNIFAHRIITAGGSITAGESISSGSGPIELRSGGVVRPGNVRAGFDLFAGGGIFSGGPPTTITVGGNLSAPGLVAGTVFVGGEMKIANITGTSVSTVAANTITAGSILMVNAPAFFPNYLPGTDQQGITPADFTLTTGSLTSMGPRIPIVNANGTSAFSNPNSNPGNGGNISLIINTGLIVGPQGDLSSITANGGDFNFGGAYGGGNGGAINITAAGPITIDSPIEAMSGRVLDGSRTAGNGGAIKLNSEVDAVAINSRIQVSSADPAIATARRRSAKGGDITLKSGKTSGVAINIANTGQLLSLLDAAAPGPGGKVTILATGANSSAKVNGTLRADRGTIDVRHTGDAGQINMGGPGPNDAIDAHGDVIKVAALGNNGVLTIGNGQLSADTTLKLYSPGSNGTVNFVADVTLGGASTKTIAGNTVNIFNGVVVTVGGSHPASVFTNNANYSGFGGNGSRTGTFGGVGATHPLPLNQLDGPGG